ncbi:MAG: MFS transporter [Candidatus Bathyarchaeia archaeon]
MLVKTKNQPSVAIYLLGLATFVIFLSAHLITPLVPDLAQNLGAEDLSIVTVIGLYIVLLALFQIFTGALADLYGKRRIIALGAFLGALSSLLCTLAWSWEQLLVLRAFGGIADAIAGPALLALVAELSGEQKGKAMGIFRSSQGLAFIIGPPLGGAMAYFFSLYTPFYADFGLTLLGILIFLFLVPEAKRERRNLMHSPLESLKFIKQDLTLMKIAFLGFTETFAFAALSSFVPAVALGLGMSGVEIAAFITAEAVGFTLTNMVIGTLSDRIGRKPIMILGLVSSSAVFVAFFSATGFWQILLLMALYGFGGSCVYVMGSTMAVDILPEENRATLFGAFDALMDLGLVAGPSICLAFLAITGWSIYYSFFFMAIPSLIALSFIFKVKETMQKR